MSLGSRLSSLLRTASRSPAVRRSVRGLGRSAMRAVRNRRPGAEPAVRPGVDRSDASSAALQDRSGGPITFSYAPVPDSRPDPGEVVWGWVPFEEDITRGKDRPVLIIAEEDAAVGGPDGSGEVLVALMLTSRDRAETASVVTDEHGATWVDIGAGDWDRQGRPSEVRADRLLRLSPTAVRREGGRVPERTFERVVDAVRSTHGWKA